MSGQTEAHVAPARALPSRWGDTARRYASADPRSLGLFRIALGLLLFLDAARRYPDIESHYANTGWLPNHFMLFRPMSDYLFSLYLACSTPGQVKVLLAIQLLVDVLLIIGFRTRFMHVLAAVLLASLNSRNVMLENGGWVVLTLLTVWSMFLPLGRRFSVDAFLRSLREQPQATLAELDSPLERDTRPVLSLAVFALVFQWIAIYAFNVLQKNGAPWRNGTAVYYALHQHGMLTWLGARLGNSLPLSAIRVLTFGALSIEAAVVVLLIFPIKTEIARMFAWLLVCVLHLSIACVLHLGTFSWSMVIPFIALIPREVWEALSPRLRARRPARVLLVPSESALALAVCRVVKRFDVLDRIQFQIDDANHGGRFAALGPGLPHRTRGLNALRSLAEALPLGRLTVSWLRLPGISGLVKRAIRRAERKPEHAAAYLELNRTPADTPPSARPAPAKAFFAELWSRLGDAALVVLLLCCVSQMLLENQVVPSALKLKRPNWVTAIIVYPRLFQGWSMFAPAPPLDDVAVVVDGRTKDGRHLDPLTGRVPSFDVSTRARSSRNCEWYYFERHLNEDRFKPYLGGVRDFLKNHHEITKVPQDQLVAFDVWSVSEAITLPGAPKAAPVKTKIFSYGFVRD
jgi:hypothetical protein